MEERRLDSYQTSTGWAFVALHLMSVPFWAVFTLLPFILYKEMGATTFEISLVITLKPLTALIAPYWSSFFSDYKRNLVLSNLLRFFPFLLLPWWTHLWWIIAAHGLFMALHRGTMATWMELIRLMFPAEKRQKLVAAVSCIDYLGGALLPLPFGFLLDHYADAWKWLFFTAALFASLSTFFLLAIPSYLKSSDKHNAQLKDARTNHSQPTKAFLANRLFMRSLRALAAPWVRSLHLLSKRKDFALFQLGFMLSGSGLMIMHTALPVFFVDELNLSYTELTMALTACKGAGFALSSPLWAKIFQQIDLFVFGAQVALLAGFFPLLLLLAPLNSFFIYLAYLLYGTMQAGSNLSWRLAGPCFSKTEESLDYTNTSILAVGMRGLFVTSLGHWLCLLAGAKLTLISGGFFCFATTVLLFSFDRQAYLDPPDRITTSS